MRCKCGGTIGEDGYCKKCGWYKENRYRSICEKCGGAYDDEGFCDVCGDDEEWTWNIPKNPNKIKCAHCGHEIYEVRRYCRFCGGKNEAAFKKGEHYCPKCGIAFENGICPSCGKKESFFLDRGISENHRKYCPVCGEEVSSNDDFCLHCGRELFIDESLFKRKNEPEHEKVKVTYKHCQRCGGDLHFDEELFSYVCSRCKSDNDEILLEPERGKKRIKCSACGNEMYEVRRYCRACGAKNELAFKKGDSYCWCCGVALVDGYCPDCGRQKISAYVRSDDEKDLGRCAVCGEQVRMGDRFCSRCGEELYLTPPKPLSEKKEPEKTEPIRSAVHTATIPEHLKTTQPAGYSGYYFADLHTTLWLVLGIISLVICCLPTGIGAIICSIGAKRAENELEYDLAKRKITFAKVWFFAGCAIVAALMIASVIIQVTTN